MAARSPARKNVSRSTRAKSPRTRRTAGATTASNPSPSPELKARAKTILRRLKKEYPLRKGFLKYRTPLDLLVATILSAQSTDKRVNMVTPALFKKYRTAADYAAASQADMEDMIRTIGLYRNKAKNIRALGHELATNHGGKVPRTIGELTALPGVGRKTANVVLGQAFDIPGMVVDTHVGRITRLLGLTTHRDPTKVERDLEALFPKSEWNFLSLRLISHGRRVCIARRPQCGECVLAPHCPSASIP